MNPRALLLDFGGVLTTGHHSTFAGFCTRAGLAADALDKALASPAGQQARAQVETGRLAQQGFEDVLAGLLGLPARGLLRHILADLRPRPEVYALVRRARTLGLRTGVLSNSLGTGEYDPYAGYELESSFDVVVLSDRVGLRKPDPAVFTLALNRLGVSAPACAFVDDSPANPDAARRLGMTAILFNGSASGLGQIEKLITANRETQECKIDKGHRR
ncbi:HAD family hydrolase [Nonomuraea typhae]|uniref:HAD family hydrolase n=1 Tax=Nonomuraea typhae TaxID=2603600 RepID=A0ABW7Z6S3_9ACTN